MFAVVDILILFVNLLIILRLWLIKLGCSVPVQRNDTGINPIIANVYNMLKVRQNLLLDISRDGSLLADIYFRAISKRHTSFW